MTSTEFHDSIAAQCVEFKNPYSTGKTRHDCQRLNPYPARRASFAAHASIDFCAERTASGGDLEQGL
jgi:hypothetical protein